MDNATCMPLVAKSIFFPPSWIWWITPIRFPSSFIIGVFCLSVPIKISAPNTAGSFLLNIYPFCSLLKGGLPHMLLFVLLLVYSVHFFQCELSWIIIMRFLWALFISAICLFWFVKGYTKLLACFWFQLPLQIALFYVAVLAGLLQRFPVNFSQVCY